MIEIGKLLDITLSQSSYFELMKTVNRRQFLEGTLLTGGALTSTLLLPEVLAQQPAEHPGAATTIATAATPARELPGQQTPVDFRYSPVLRQTAFCFPDDPHKSLINETGELLYGYDRENNIFYFPLKIGFVMGGMQPDRVMEQTMESPSIPILRTVLERADAILTLTSFATNNTDEGRVDNVLLEIYPRNLDQVNVSPLVHIHTAQKYELTMADEILIVSHAKTQAILFVGKVFGNPIELTYLGSPTPTHQQLNIHPGVASLAKPYRAFFRFPQAGQTSTQLQAGLENPDQQLRAARKFWLSWLPFHQPVSWQVPGREGEFVTACARNILQAREVRKGKLTFQVGPTCYRGLWVVDGNFILEAARYLGYDKEAIEGLRTTWSQQEPSGQIVAAGGLEHYKDTAIAMFTLVRQCELGQDWSPLHELEPNVVAAIQFIRDLRARARVQDSVLGRYGLLPRGLSDGGFDGSREELTNTLWTMAGLKAIGIAGEQRNMPELARATALYQELSTDFNHAAQQEMRSYHGRFEYLPMLLKEDPAWQLPNPWDRPRPQCAQWALSHTIFPGRVFDPQHPIVKGHVDLMQAVRREGIPADTGWKHHEAVWPYNAPFVAEVYLWLGMRQSAHDTFIGFLNHASPQYCWVEEQPLQDALLGSCGGDMPHNWASAECIRYMRHIFALEDGADLRLLAGITESELAPGNPYLLQGTPTRFGRLDIALEPLDRKQGWRLTFSRAAGPTPDSVSLPVTLGARFQLAKTEGVQLKRNGAVATVDPDERNWSVIWRA